MGTNSYFSIIFGVLKNFYVIGTVVAMILVIEFAKFVTTYKKRPPRPKIKKEDKKAVAAPAEKGAEGEEETSADGEKA